MAANYLTTGRWSPTRPGMLFLGKVDGSMDVWDFTDSSFTPSVTLMSSPSRITRLVVWFRRACEIEHNECVEVPKGDGN